MKKIIGKNSIKDIDDICIKKGKKYSDTIYTLDIEVTSAFCLDGVWQPFDFSRRSEEYENIQKVGIPYIYMFGVNETVYYGREFRQLEEVFKKISDKKVLKYCYIHNLSYEMHFLLNIFENYTIKDMVCRDVHKPIQFLVKELNIMFRCSYMLTNMSLANAATNYTEVKKKTGDLDYNVLRTPYTKLTETEMGYCEYDIICLYYIVLYFLKKYQHIYKIPLTATSIVRQKLKKVVDYWYMKNQWNLVPDAETYLKLMACFSGGYTHSCLVNTNKVFSIFKKEKPDPEIISMDIASSYPFSLCTEKYPASPFVMCRPSLFETQRSRYCFLLKIALHDVKPRYYNHYIQNSHVDNAIRKVVSNGRVSSLRYGEMWVTDIDYDLIKMSYKCKIDILECYKSKKKFLDKRIIKFILDLYVDKTKYKGVTSPDGSIEDYYRSQKAHINSVYGMAVTNALKQSSDFIDGVWTRHELTKEFIEGKIEDMKKSWSTLMFYAVGCWCTAYSRYNLLTRIFKAKVNGKDISKQFDKDVLYMDTDSLKFKYKPEYMKIFEEYNESLNQKYYEVCKKYPDDITLDMFRPKDKNGIEHPLGYYELDGRYSEFKTLGAKKYCYRDIEDGELHLTVAGVSKKGVTALKNNINNFKKGMIWGYKESGKLTHFYLSEQPEVTITDYQGNKYTSNYKYGIVLQPTTYELGIEDKYEALVKYFMIKEYEENGKRKTGLSESK